MITTKLRNNKDNDKHNSRKQQRQLKPETTTTIYST